MANYAEFNPTVNYSHGYESNTMSNPFANMQTIYNTKNNPNNANYQQSTINYNNDANSKQFNKTQFTNKQPTTNYYCGGDSSLALRSVQMTNTPVSRLFFSDENFERLQKQLKRKIFEMSNGVFKVEVDQDRQDMLIAMRAVYLDNAKNLSDQIVRQVKELNILTINYIAPDMLTNIKQQYNYLRDISQPNKTIDRPLNVNKAGRKSLPSYTSVWGNMPVTNTF